ncbi:uncharacterized protein LOC144011524 isoform X8 [Festucalex cinctus]
MAESAEGFVNGVQIIGDVCPLGVVSTGVLPSEEQEHCSRKEAAMDQTQEGMEKMLGELMAVTCQCSQVVCKILLKMVCCCLPCLDPEQRFVGLMGCLSTRS